jgi:DNA uptake protein ComE-like DNA-binding protein
MGVHDKRASRGDSGLALIATLWIMAVLSVLATEYLYMVHLDRRMARNVVDGAQLEYAAKAGIARFKRVLAEDDTTFDSTDEEWAQAIEGELEDPDIATKTYAYELSATDENALIDVNTAEEGTLTNLIALTAVPEDQRAEIVQGIVDARPFRTPGDVARAEGMTSDILYGGEEVGGDEQGTPLINLITIYAVDKNVQTGGEERVNITDADADALVQGLTGQDGAELLSQGEAEAITAQRDEEQYDSVGDLMDIPAVSQSVLDQVRDQLATDDDDNNLTNVNSASAEDLGNVDGLDEGIGEAIVRHRDDNGDYGDVDDIRDAMLITRDEMKWVVDKATVVGEDTVRGLVNINTASQEVLALLPGMDGDKAQAIIDRRDSPPNDPQSTSESQTSPFKTLGELLDVEQIDDDTYKQVVGSLTYRAQAFRIQANGLTPEGKAVARITAVLDRSGQNVATRYWLTN